MNPNVNKMNLVSRTFALVAMAAFAMLASGLIQQTAAQKYSHQSKAKAFAQQGSTNTAATTTFNSGRDLIDDAQWARAEQEFAKYISSYPQEKNLDAAMYWKAYAESKLRKYEQSKETLQKLLKTYEKTIWKEDAELLLAQLPTASVAVKVDPVIVNIDQTAPTVAVSPTAVTVITDQDPIRTQEIQEKIAEAKARADERVAEQQERIEEKVKEAKERAKVATAYGIGRGVGMGIGDDVPDDDPCEFKIVVLQALFESDPQRGLAVASDWLKAGSGQTVTCKRAALTLLARHGGKAVTPTILAIAQNETDLKLKTRAISLLGASNDESVLGALRDFAINSPQNEVVEAALFALSQHNSPQALNALADIALSNRPVTLRKTAISFIANRAGEPAVDALFKIYDSTQDLEIRKSVISGFSRRKSERAGTKLLEIAQRSDNIELRKAAISGIGRRGGASAVDMLMGLYDSEKNEEMKDQIMSAFSYSNDKRVTQKLISIAKNPQTTMERRRRAIVLLSGRNKDPEVIAYFEELLKQ